MNDHGVLYSYSENTKYSLAALCLICLIGGLTVAALAYWDVVSATVGVWGITIAIILAAWLIWYAVFRGGVYETVVTPTEVGWKWPGGHQVLKMSQIRTVEERSNNDFFALAIILKDGTEVFPRMQGIGNPGEFSVAIKRAVERINHPDASL